jgi:hypothetical protein
MTIEGNSPAFPPVRRPRADAIWFNSLTGPIDSPVDLIWTTSLQADTDTQISGARTTPSPPTMRALGSLAGAAAKASCFLLVLAAAGWMGPPVHAQSVVGQVALSWGGASPSAAGCT